MDFLIDASRRPTVLFDLAWHYHLHITTSVFIIKIMELQIFLAILTPFNRRHVVPYLN